MGNTFHKERRPHNRSKTKTDASINDLKRIGQKFERKKEIFIYKTSNAAQFTKEGNKFLRNLLVTLDFHVKHNTGPINRLIPAFKNRKLTSHLSLNLQQWWDKDVKKFIIVFYFMRNVSTLSLRFSGSSHLTGQGAKLLASGLENMLLSELTLTFHKCLQISEEGFLALFSSLKHLICLSSFVLNLSCNKALNMRPIKRLLSSLKRLRLLKTLRISIDGIENEGIEALFSGLRKLKHISHLSLIYDLSFNLVFGEDCLKGVPITFASFKCLTSLELILDFRISENESIVFKYISSGLKALTSLKSLALFLPRGLRYTDNEFESFLEAFKEMKALQKLEWRFAPKEFNDQCLDKLSLGFKDLKMLQSLSLLFTWVQGLTNQGLENLFLTFKDMKSLTSLQLKFQDCSRFDKKVLHSLYENLKEVSSLKHLFLRISLIGPFNEEEKKEFISKFDNVRVDFYNIK